MPLNPSDLKDIDIIGHVNRGFDPMIGINIPDGFYKGKKLNQAGRGLCGITRWIADNTEWLVSCVMEFYVGGSNIIIRFRRKNGSIVRDIGPATITGKTMGDRGFANVHEILGLQALLKVAEEIEKKLIEEGDIVEETDNVDGRGNKK